MAFRPRVSLAAWTEVLADTLLPVGVSPGRQVRLDCDDDAVADAGRALGLTRSDAVKALTDCLKTEGGVDAGRGVRPLATAVGDPPAYLPGLCVLVLAASRMQGSERNTMAAYYVHLADLLDIPLRNAHPRVAGVRELVACFGDLACWMECHECGRRGLLDLPADVHPSIIGVPISQSLLRAGDRLTLGSFFERTGRLINAGWDPVNQLSHWGGRHSLSTPLQKLLDEPDLHDPLAAALRTAHARWDGATVDADGRRLLTGQLTLHLPPTQFTVAATVPALDRRVTATGPADQTIDLEPGRPTAVPLDWLASAQHGPVIVDTGDERVRVLGGPTMLFEVTQLGVQSVAAAADHPVWVLTCDPDLIARCPSTARMRTPLPADWQLLCDIEPQLLAEDLRVDTSTEDRALSGVTIVGGLQLGEGVWLLDHPPQITADLPDPAPVIVDGEAHGDIETGRTLSLQFIAHEPGVHRVEIGEQEIVIELAERGKRAGIGSIGFDLDPQRIHAGASVHPDGFTCRTTLTGPVTAPAPAPAQMPMTVRYRAAVDIIDRDGTVRALAPPAPASWIEQAGLPTEGSWEIAQPDTVVWLCVNAPKGKFVVAHAVADVPITDAVLDVVDWYRDAARVIDRTAGGAMERWQRLLDILTEAEEALT